MENNDEVVDATTENQAQKVSAESTPSVEELLKMYESEKAKAARILAEKKSEREKFESLQAQLDQFQQAEKQRKLESLSTEEKYNMMLQEKEESLLTLKKQLEENNNKYKNLQRQIKLNNIAGDIQFKSEIPVDVRNYAIENTFKDIDLDDDFAVKSAKSQIFDKYKAMILATPQTGGGTQPVKEATVTSPSEGTLTKEEYMAMPREARLKISSADRARLMGDIN